MVEPDPAPEPAEVVGHHHWPPWFTAVELVGEQERFSKKVETVLLGPPFQHGLLIDDHPQGPFVEGDTATTTVLRWSLGDALVAQVDQAATLRWRMSVNAFRNPSRRWWRVSVW